MDIFGNKEDEQLMRDFWGANEGHRVMDMDVLSAKWHK